MSRELRFTTPQPRGPTAFPQRIGVIADLGQTHNSSTTLDHLIQSDPPVRTLILQHAMRAVPGIARSAMSDSKKRQRHPYTPTGKF